MKKEIYVGSVGIGGNNPISIQSMTNTKTEDHEATLEQIRKLYIAGCEIVRVSVYNGESANALKAIIAQSPIPLVADIHFDYRLAIKSIENGISKLRLNPGNIGKEEHVKKVVDCAKMHHVPIRIGVNSGSVPKEIIKRDGKVTARGLVDSVRNHVRFLEDSGFEDIVISIKSSDVKTMVEACRLADSVFPYPLHLGVTEAGLPGQGTIKSAIGIGSLLLDGIGSTLRVSLSGSPIPEIEAAYSILRALNLRSAIQLISCPTCGRTEIDVESIARKIEEKTKNIKRTLKVAIMGCIVNGPGEALEADIAICGGKNKGALFVGGKYIKTITEDYDVEVLNAIANYDLYIKGE